MNSFHLKLIACIAMFIDHFSALFISNSSLYVIGRGIGRIAFPIFCYLIVEGYFHTRDIKKYLLRLGLFALISEIPFDLAFWDVLFMKNIFSSQNVFFTLFLGLLTITVYDHLATKYRSQPWIFNTLAVVTIVVGGTLAILIKSDYDVLGILLILIFYLFHGNRKRTAIAYILYVGFLFSGLQLLAIFSLVFIWYYNGEKGRSVKYAFYAFYPLHLLVFGLIVRYLI